MFNSWKDASKYDAKRITGADGFMDASDILEVFEECGIRPRGLVVEIGAGTGRLAQICDKYIGYDISRGLVDYAREQGIDVRFGLPDEEIKADWLFIVHVFCHIPRAERKDYLKLDIAPRLLVDIIPGDGNVYGGPLIYTTPVEEFRDDLEETHWNIVKEYVRPKNETGTRKEHHYFICER